MDKLLYTRKEAAEMLSISLDTLDGLRTFGEIKDVRIGTRVYITPHELNKFVRGLEVKNA